MYRPVRHHACSPGWTYSEPELSDRTMWLGAPLFPGQRIAHPPSGYDYPEGTVWQCECGRTWVSAGPPGRCSPGLVNFRPERRGERRRRERRG